MKPYKLKHVPTGLYYQPHKHRGSNWSKLGKIYQTKLNPLKLGLNKADSPISIITIYCHEDTIVYNNLKDKLVWIKCYDNDYKTDTLSSDWIIEDI